METVLLQIEISLKMATKVPGHFDILGPGILLSSLCESHIVNVANFCFIVILNS